VKPETLILTRQQVVSLLDLKECTDAVEEVFRMYGRGETESPGILGIHVEQGSFHIKAGTLRLKRNYFVAKVNANFPDNKRLFELPTIQGAIVLCDADNGQLLALMDSIEITIVRTGAATAVAAKYLARPDSQTLSIIGCGSQGRISVRALCNVLPIKQVFVYDINQSIAQKLVEELSEDMPILMTVAGSVSECVRVSDVCVTCTTSKQPFLKLEDVPPGIFIAAVGADNEDKHELQPAIVAAGKLVTDLTEQCCSIGELQHAIRENVLQRGSVYSELGEVVSGKKVGRLSPEEIIIFDSTGMALQDVAAAAIVYEKALDSGIGMKLGLSN